MKRNIILLLIITLLTGCTVNYNLEIGDNKIIETINGTITQKEIENRDNSTGVNIYRSLLYDEQKVFENKSDLYTKEVIDEEDTIHYNFTYTYLKDYQNSRIIQNCFSNPIIIETDEAYDIQLAGKFSCLKGEKVTVNLKTDYAIIENNANEVKDNTYTWIIDKEDVDISVTISKKIKQKQKEEKPFFTTFKIVGFIVLIVLSSITYFLYKKKNDIQI